MALPLLLTLVSFLLAAAALALGAPPALAHAVLLKSQPQTGQVMAQSPTSVQLVFDEPVQLTRLQSVRSDGTTVAAQQTWPLTDTITWTLPDTLTDGGWLVSYSVISTDSHPVSGTIRFIVGGGQVTFGTAPAPDDTITEYPRFLLLAGTLTGAGLLFAGALFNRRAPRRIASVLVAAWVAAAIGSVTFVYATAEAAGGGAAALTAAIDILGYGLTLTMIGLTAGIAFAWADRRRLMVFAAVATLIGLGLSGHVAAAPPAWLSRPAYVIHVVAVAVWLGSLIVLLRRRAMAPSADPLALFSRLAAWLVAALVVCGFGLIAVQAGTAATLIESDYGLVLAVKLVFVAALLGLAAWNRWRLTRPALAGDAPAERRLGMSIRAEIALFAVILAVTAILGTTVPPRSIVAAALPVCGTPDPVTRRGSDIGLDITLTFRSACSGRNNIALALAWQDGRPLVAREVQLRFSQPALNVEPFDVYMDGKDGRFNLVNFDLPLAGEWRIETRILLDEYTLRRIVFRVPLAPAPQG
jgi:copper transport protein